jgi:hypothetical protein
VTCWVSIAASTRGKTTGIALELILDSNALKHRVLVLIGVFVPR